MSEENKAISRRFYEEVFTKGNLSALEEFIAADFVDHNPFGPETVSSLEGLKEMFGMFNAAFPDMTLTVEDQIAEGDKVVSRFTTTGTHKGEFMGIPATGKTVTISAIDIHRIENGQIVEHWDEVDMLGMMQQLGVVPAPGE